MTRRKRISRVGGAAVVLSTLFVAACAPVGVDRVDRGGSSGTGIERVTGEFSWRERVMLRPGTIAEVSLIDVSRADAPARVIATQTIENLSVPPVPFVLEYDSAVIDERMSYAVRAVIRDENRLLFTTDTQYPVLTRGAGNTVDLVLKQVESAKTKPDVSLTNTYWKLVAIGSEAYRHDSANREPHLKYRDQDSTVAGFTGCNMLTGRFETNGDVMRFQNLAVTQRACLQGMAVEAKLLKALGEVNRYDIQGETLRLFRDDEQLLGFSAIYF